MTFVDILIHHNLIASYTERQLRKLSHFICQSIFTESVLKLYHNAKTYFTCYFIFLRDVYIGHLVYCIALKAQIDQRPKCGLCPEAITGLVGKQ